MLLLIQKLLDYGKSEERLKSKQNIESDLWNFLDSYEANLWTQRDINNKSAWSLRLKFQDKQPIVVLIKT